MKLTFSFAVLALGLASAASSKGFDLKKPVTIGTTQLQPGSYRVEMQGDKAVLKTGKTVIEVPATLGNGTQKFGSTDVVTNGAQLVEIDLGGTTQKILFSPKTGESVGGGH